MSREAVETRKLRSTRQSANTNNNIREVTVEVPQSSLGPLEPVNLFTVFELAYSSIVEDVPIVELINDRNIEVRRLLSLLDLQREAIYEAKIQIVTLSSSLYMINCGSWVQCKCGYSTFVPPSAGLVIKCPLCNEVMTVTRKMIVPAKQCKLFIEIERKSHMLDGFIIGKAVQKARGGFVNALMFITSKQVKKAREENLEVPVVYIIEIFDNDNGKSSIDQVMMKLEHEHIIKQTGDIPEIIDREKYLAMLVSSFAFGVYGMSNEKLLLLAALAGGYCDYVAENSDRYWINALLVGDPSTAKSKLVTAVLECAPRSLLLTADMASAVSLIAAEVAPGQISLGPLALMDGGPEDFGIVVVEQIETWKPEKIMNLRDILERGQAGRAIRGMTQDNIPTRCGLVVTANWEYGDYRPNLEFIENLPKVLRNRVDLSRFDVLITTLEYTDPEQKVKIIKHKLEIAAKKVRPVLTHADIRELIRHVRKIKPRLEVSEKVIWDLVHQLDIEYKKLGLKGVPIRTFDAIVRIAAGLAKLMFSTKVTDYHIELAYKLIQDQLLKVRVQVPQLPPRILTLKPSKQKLLDYLRQMIIEECGENACKKDDLLLRFKQEIDKAIENGIISQSDMAEIGDLGRFFDWALSVLEQYGIIYRPTHDTVRVVK